MKNEKLLSVSNLTKKTGRRVIVDDISFDLHHGEIVSIIGPNGGGKTSLVRIILGLMSKTSGNIDIKDKIKISYMPQRINIDKNLSMDVSYFFKLLIGSTNREEIVKVCKKLKIDNILNKQIHHLSGGEMQKVLLARCILERSDLLILDEPTQNLDINSEEEVYKIIENMRTECNCGILLISHDLHVVMRTTDWVVCLDKHICCAGKPEHVSEHPKYHSLFNKTESITIYNHPKHYKS